MTNTTTIDLGTGVLTWDGKERRSDRVHDQTVRLTFVPAAQGGAA